jgi:FixJ family two-component response regulator
VVEKTENCCMSKAMSWIAIVDDDPSVLKALSRLLKSHAFRTSAFKSAAEFLRALPDGLPECLILDLHMPEMTGLQLQLHLGHSGIKIPTIVITGSENGARERCNAAGASAFLLKPITEAALFEALDAAKQGSVG